MAAAHKQVSFDLQSFETIVRLEPDAVVVHQADDRNGHLEQNRSQLSDVVE
jgi:hypothetical protein